MNWYWHVRIYRKDGQYWHAEIITARNLQEIDGIQDFYAVMTGCKMLLEGMSEEPTNNLDGIQTAFDSLWCQSVSPADRGGEA